MSEKVQVNDVVEILREDERKQGFHYGSVHHFEGGIPVVRLLHVNGNLVLYGRMEEGDLKLVYRPEPERETEPKKDGGLARLEDVKMCLRNPNTLRDIVAQVIGPIPASIMMLLAPLTDRLGPDPYAEITIDLQAGNPVMVKVTTKHKPVAESPKKDEPKGLSPREQYRAVLQGQIDTLTLINKGLSSNGDADSLHQLRENQGQIRLLTVELLNN